MKKSQLYMAIALFLTSILSTSATVYAGPPDEEELKTHIQTHKAAIIDLKSKPKDEVQISTQNQGIWAISEVKFYKEDPSEIIDNLKNTAYSLNYDIPIFFQGNRFNYTEEQFKKAREEATEINTYVSKEIKNVPQNVFILKLKKIN